MLPPVGIEPRPLITSDSKSNTVWTKLTFASKTETLESLYGHALLIVAKSSQFLKYKNQVVHEQKFKDLLSSTWQVSVERIVLDLESEAMRGPGSIPTRGNIFHWIFLFSRSKVSAADIGIIAILVHFEKNSIGGYFCLHCIKKVNQVL